MYNRKILYKGCQLHGALSASQNNQIKCHVHGNHYQITRCRGFGPSCTAPSVSVPCHSIIKTLPNLDIFCIVFMLAFDGLLILLDEACENQKNLLFSVDQLPKN